MNLIDHAIAFAAKAHEGQYRKMTDVPYISHPFAVGMILMQEGCSEEMVAAGILHDVVEDTAATQNELVHEFGETIAGIVEGCSEPDKSLSWKKRKVHTIEYLKTATSEVKVVAAADKLHNIRSIQEDQKTLGEGIWERFNKGKNEQAWYYQEIVKSLREGISSSIGAAIFDELQMRVEELFGD